MIKLSKHAKPAILVLKETDWTIEYRSDNTKRRWSHTEITSALNNETARKCAYCESKVDAVTWIHVEHILCKAIHIDLVVDWNNLTLACPKCNQNKGAYDNPLNPLVNPYAVDPRAHLQFVAGFIRPRNNSMMGRMTIVQIDLRRAELFERRMEAIDEVETQIENYNFAPNPELKQYFKSQVWARTSSEYEYSAAVMDYLAAVKFPR